MLPYIIMVAVPALLSLVFYNYENRRMAVCESRMQVYTEKSSYRIVVDAFFFIWLILLIFRSVQVGVDLIVYDRYFDVVSSWSWRELLTAIFYDDLEAGYYVLCKLISLITTDFHLVIAVCALISVIPIWRFYRKDGSNGFLVILLFLNVAPFVMYFSGLRQSMAMAFAVPCYYFCRDKRFWKFLLMIFLAYLFHKSALVLLLMYPVYHFKLKKQAHIFYLIPIFSVIYIFNVPIFSFLLVLLQDGYIDKYGGGIKKTGASAVLLLLAVLLIYSFLIVDQSKLDKETVGMRNFLALSVCLQTFAGVHTLAMRMNYYYLLFVPLLIDRVIQSADEKYAFLVKLSKFLMVSFFFLYYFYFAYTDKDILNIYPYIAAFYDY